MFDTDTHRRVAGNLSVPRTFGNLLIFLGRHDQHVTSDVDSLLEVLNDLVDAGYVKNVGQHATPEDALEAVQADDDTITLHDEKAENYVALAANPAKKTLTVDGELYVLTAAGLDALTGGDE